MEVRLIGFTSGLDFEDPEKLVEFAGRVCRHSQNNMAGDSHREFIGKLKQWGHLSPLEHVSATFFISGISRACSHQLVRHRLASYSQQSQRYVAESSFEYVTPPSVNGKEKEKIFNETMEIIKNQYRRLVDAGVPQEDARYLLPNACATAIVVTMNARELRHFFKLRLHPSAQWEIREMAKSMLSLVQERTPTLFEDIYAKYLGDHPS